MATLQRSSISFRRQGSSGRIWDDLQIVEQKTGNLHIIDKKTGMPIDIGKQEDKQLQIDGSNEEEERKVEDSSPRVMLPSGAENQALTEKRGRGWGISSVFGRCMGPPAS